MQNAESIKENLSETSYLRMSDLKKLFPVSVGTLYNWSKKGIIKPIKITDGVTVYDRKQVEGLLGINQGGTES